MNSQPSLLRLFSLNACYLGDLAIGTLGFVGACTGDPFWYFYAAASGILLSGDALLAFTRTRGSSAFAHSMILVGTLLTVAPGLLMVGGWPLSLVAATLALGRGLSIASNMRGKSTEAAVPPSRTGALVSMAAKAAAAYMTFNAGLFGLTATLALWIICDSGTVFRSVGPQPRL